MTAETCALSLLSMSTLTSAEYDFITNLVGPVTDKQSPTAQSTPGAVMIPSSSRVSSADHNLRGTIKSDSKQDSMSTITKNPNQAAESELVTEELLDVHWHEPLMEGLLEPIINYLRSEGIQIAPKEELVTNNTVDDDVSQTICLRDIEPSSGLKSALPHGHP